MKLSPDETDKLSVSDISRTLPDRLPEFHNDYRIQQLTTDNRLT
jgi:hypothetical protein